MTTFSADLAKFLVGLRTENLPPEVVQKARVCLCNAFGMGINGHATPYAPVARAAALALDGEVAGGATLFLDGRRTTIGGACLANSALFHGRAQEDTCGAAHFYDGIRRAHRDSHLPRERGRKQTFKYARYGRRDWNHCEAMASK